MQIAYHNKTKKDGWKLFVTAPHDHEIWDKQDKFAIEHMLTTGNMTLTMGNCMWQIVKQEATK